MLKNLTVNFDYKTELSSFEIHKFVSVLKKELKFKLDFLEILFVSKERIIEFNNLYLNHDYSTDVISLSFGDGNEILSGQIFISIEDAAENAKLFNVSHREELIRLVTHGVLHLVGYDDKSKKDKTKMKEVEDRLTKNLVNL